MFHHIKSIFFPQEKILESTNALIKLLRVNITQSVLRQSLEEHVEYPSLLSVSDVLSSFGVSNISVRMPIMNISSLPMPLMAQIKVPHPDLEKPGFIFDKDPNTYYFSTIKEVKEGILTYLDPVSSTWRSTNIQDFAKIATGVVLIPEVQKNAGQKDFIKHDKEEQEQKILQYLSIFLIPTIFGLYGFYSLYNNPNAFFATFTLLLLLTVGVFLCLLLIWYELDEFNPGLKELCSSKKNMNCGAVLSSKGSSIFGVNWSIVGFSYFAGILIFLLTTRMSSDALNFLSVTSLLSVPYIFFSLYYQAKVVKQWCPLCLAVQGTLLLVLLLTIFTENFVVNVPQMDLIIAALLCFSVPFISVMIISRLLRKAKQGDSYRIKFHNLVRNVDIFNSLLQNQKKIQNGTENLGVIIGNPQAKIKIVKVCNPYCGPCGKSHQVLDSIIDNNNDVSLQIIFTATTKINDHKSPPVKHFLAIAESGNLEMLRNALNDWYQADTRDYETFSKRYPINGLLTQQQEKIDMMNVWCQTNDINFTPTIFVNGHLLPTIYTTNDLNFLLISDSSVSHNN